MSWLEAVKSFLNPNTRLPSGDLQRWVAVDVETSGLDTQKDQLMAIACVGIQVDWRTGSMRLCPGDSLELMVKPQVEVSDKGNILVHGLSPQRQALGDAAEEALKKMHQFMGDSPLLAFHAWFDQQVLTRHLKLHQLPALNNAWLDIEHLCIATHKKTKAHSLDDWMTHLDIQCPARHRAIADTWAECELLQRIWPEIKKHCASWQDMQKLAKRARWQRMTNN